MSCAKSHLHRPRRHVDLLAVTARPSENSMSQSKLLNSGSASLCASMRILHAGLGRRAPDLVSIATPCDPISTLSLPFSFSSWTPKSCPVLATRP
jgi:hypothetical protein